MTISCDSYTELKEVYSAEVVNLQSQDRYSKVHVPKGLSVEYSTYVELMLTLASSKQSVNVKGFIKEEKKLSWNTYSMYLISPLVCEANTFTSNGSSLEEAKRNCLNQVACAIEKVSRGVVNCNSQYRDMLEPQKV